VMSLKRDKSTYQLRLYDEIHDNFQELCNEVKLNASLPEKEKKIFFEKLMSDNLDWWGVRTETIVRFNLDYKLDDFLKVIKSVKSSFEQLCDAELIFLLNRINSNVINCLVVCVLESRGYFCQKNMCASTWHISKHSQK